MKVWEYPQYLQAEGMKQAAEAAVGFAGTNYLGQKALELYASSGSGRIIDDSLKTEIAGIELENPLIVGAGWV